MQHVAFGARVQLKATVSLRKWSSLCTLSLIFQLAQAARPAEPPLAALAIDKDEERDETTIPSDSDWTNDASDSSLREGQGGCPEASQGKRSRLDFFLDYQGARHHNPYSNYSLYYDGLCTKQVLVGASDRLVDVTIFSRLNTTQLNASYAVVAVDDLILLQPDVLDNRRLNVCGYAPGAGSDFQPVCLCSVRIRHLPFGNSLRRRGLELIKYVPKKILSAATLVMSATILISPENIKKKANTRNKDEKSKPEDVVLMLLRELEMVEFTDNSFCPRLLEAFDIMYLGFLLACLCLSIILCVQWNSRGPPWYDVQGEPDHTDQVILVPSPWKLMRACGLQMFAFIGFMIAMQTVALEYVQGMPSFLPVIIILTAFVAVVEILRVFRLLCQVQLASCAMRLGLLVSWDTSSAMLGILGALFDDIAMAGVIGFICTLAVWCAGGRMHAAWMALWPSAIGAGKTMAFVFERDLQMFKAHSVTAFPSLARLIARAKSDASALSNLMKVPKQRPDIDNVVYSGETEVMEMSDFLHLCRHSENPIGGGTLLLQDEALDENEQETAESNNARPASNTSPGGSDPFRSALQANQRHHSFRVIRDLTWHGRIVYKLSGSKVALINPLLVVFLLWAVIGVSALRLTGVMCLPPKLRSLTSPQGRTVPLYSSFRIGQEYGIMQSSEARGLQLYVKTLRSMKMEDAQGSEVQTTLTDRSHEYVITPFIVTSAMFSKERSQTYTVSTLPMTLIPTTISIRYGDFRVCVWYSGVWDYFRESVSLPSGKTDALGESNESMKLLEVSVSLREITLDTPRHLDEWAEWNRNAHVPVGTFCRKDADDSAESCTTFCDLDPRCHRSFSTSTGCCFVMSQFHTPNTDAACWKENNASAERPLRRLPWRRDVYGRSMANLSGNAVVRSGGKWIPLLLNASSNGVLQWKAEGVEVAPTCLKLSKLKAWQSLDKEDAGMYVKLSKGTPNFVSVLVALEDIEDDELIISTNRSRSQITVQITIKHWDFLRSGHDFYMHVAPLLDHVGFEANWKLFDAEKYRPADGLSRTPDKLVSLFNKSCDRSDTPKLFQMCGGPMKPTVASAYVNIWRTPEMMRRVVSMGSFTVIAQQTSADLFEPRRVELELDLQNQEALPRWLKQQGCQVLNKTAKNAATLGVPKDAFATFACMVLQSGCRTLTMVQNQGVWPKMEDLTLPVLPVDGESQKQLSILRMAERRYRHPRSAKRAVLALCAAAHPDFTHAGGERMLLDKVKRMDTATLLKKAKEFPQGGIWLRRLLFSCLESDSLDSNLRRITLLRSALVLENADGKHNAVVTAITEALVLSSPQSWQPNKRLSWELFDMLKNKRQLEAGKYGLQHNSQAMLETLMKTLPDGMFSRLSNFIIQRYLDVLDSEDKDNIVVIRHLQTNLLDLILNGLLRPDELHIYADEAKAAAEREGGGIETAVRAFLKTQLALLKEVGVTGLDKIHKNGTVEVLELSCFDSEVEEAWQLVMKVGQLHTLRLPDADIQITWSTLNWLERLQERWRSYLVHLEMSDLRVELDVKKYELGHVQRVLGQVVFKKLHRLQTMNLSVGYTVRKGQQWHTKLKDPRSFFSLGRATIMQATWLAPKLRVLDWSGIYLTEGMFSTLLETVLALEQKQSMRDFSYSCALRRELRHDFRFDGDCNVTILSILLTKMPALEGLTFTTEWLLSPVKNFRNEAKTEADLQEIADVLVAMPNISRLNLRGLTFFMLPLMPPLFNVRELILQPSWALPTYEKKTKSFPGAFLTSLLGVAELFPNLEKLEVHAQGGRFRSLVLESFLNGTATFPSVRELHLRLDVSVANRATDSVLESLLLKFPNMTKLDIAGNEFTAVQLTKLVAAVPHSHLRELFVRQRLWEKSSKKDLNINYEKLCEALKPPAAKLVASDVPCMADEGEG